MLIPRPCEGCQNAKLICEVEQMHGAYLNSVLQLLTVGVAIFTPSMQLSSVNEVFLRQWNLNGCSACTPLDDIVRTLLSVVPNPEAQHKLLRYRMECKQPAEDICATPNGKFLRRIYRPMLHNDVLIGHLFQYTAL